MRSGLKSLPESGCDEPLQLISQKVLIPGQTYSALLEIMTGKQDPILDTYPARHRAYIRQNLKQLPAPRRLFPIATGESTLLADLDAKLGKQAEFAKALLFSDSTPKETTGTNSTAAE